MKRLKDRGHIVDLQILDNEASTDYRRIIKEEWHVKLQLVLPDVHRRNTTELAIQTSNAHFLSVLAGVDPTLPKYMWDLLLNQTEPTLILLLQATLDPSISAC